MCLINTMEYNIKDGSWSTLCSVTTAIHTIQQGHIVGTSLGLPRGLCRLLLEALESLPTDASFNAALILTHLRGDKGVVAPLLKILDMKLCMSWSFSTESKLFVLDGWKLVTTWCDCISVWLLYSRSDWLLKLSLLLVSWKWGCDVYVSVDAKLPTEKLLYDSSEKWGCFCPCWPNCIAICPVWMLSWTIAEGAVSGPKSVLPIFDICNDVILGPGKKVPWLGLYGMNLFVTVW